MPDLPSLLERLGQLEEPSREVDCMIYHTINPAYGPIGDVPGQVCYMPEIRGGHPFQCARYTASVDAALTLVPEGWHWSAGNRTHDSTGETIGEPYGHISPNGLHDSTKVFTERAPTPAIALTIAALKARG